MKIGLLIYGSLDTVSGGYLYDRKLVEYLRSRGDIVEIISLPWRNYAAHLTDNLRFKLPIGLDILVQDELNHPSLIAANRNRHPYPVISLVHHLRSSESRSDWQNWFYGKIEKIYLQSVDGLIFNSETTREAVFDLMGEGKPWIIAHPPTDRFGVAIEEADIKARARNRELRILFLGNLIHRKGLHTLLDALKLVDRGALPFLKVDVVGSLTTEPQYVQTLQRQIREIGLSPIIDLHGPLDNEPLIEIYRKSHIVVVPSSYEGFGIVYLEGMGFGLPAIGTNAGAAGEIITHGIDGYLIRPGDCAALASYLTELLENRELLLELSFNAVKRFHTQPKWDVTAKNVREFLQTFISGREFPLKPRT